MDAWNACLEGGARFSEMHAAIRVRDVAKIREIWSELVARLDNQTFYGFLCGRRPSKSFRHREIFGQVGFCTGGWDTDFPNSILEILRVVYTGADDHHRGIVGGSQQLPMRLWERSRAGPALAAGHLAVLAARGRARARGDPAAPHRRQPHHGDRRRRRHPHLPCGGLHRADLDAALQDRL